MAAVKQVLIIGGGIAGLTLAIALRRKGIACDVAEISDQTTGAAIGLTGRAPLALREVGLMERCAAAGRLIPVNFLARQRGAEGELLKMKGVPQFSDGWRGRAIVKLLQWTGKLPPGPGTISIYRPALAAILRAEAARLGACIRIPLHIEKLHTAASGVDAEFVGGEVLHYDLIVGADGVHSIVRQLVFGDIVKPEFSGQISLRWMVSGPFAPGPAGFYNASGALVAIGELPGPLTYVASGFDAVENRKIGPEEARAILDSKLALFTAPKIVELRKRLTPGQEVIVRPFEWLLVPKPWHSSRVVLIGDAAHATTAHLASGGGMAIEDAVVLAQCLAAASSLSVALDRFMARRFERVRMIVETSLKIGDMMQQNAPVSDIQKLRRDAMQLLAQPY